MCRYFFFLLFFAVLRNSFLVYSHRPVRTQFLFAPALQPGQHRAEQQIDEGDFDVQRQMLIVPGGDALGHHEHLHHRDVGGKGGVLHHGDQVVGQGGEGRAHGLGQQNAAHDLHIAHAHAAARLQLPLGHGFQGRPDGLGAVGPLVDGEHQHRRGEGLQQDAQVRQSVKNHIQLHQQRGAPDHPDVKPGDLLEHLYIGKLDNGRNDGNDQSQREGDHRQGDGHGQPRQQNLGEGFQKNPE